MKKIMFHLNCLEQGGVERVVTNLANQFKEDGWDVIIATEWYGENEFIPNEGIRRIHVGLLTADESNNRVLKYVKRIQYLRGLVLKERPDIIVAFAEKANYRAIMATRFTKIPVLISIRTDPVGHYDNWKSRIMIPLFYHRASGTVFQTTGQKEFFSKKMQIKSRIILNPINPKYIGRKIVEHRTKEIVHSGRIFHAKNQEMLIKAFADIHQEYPEYILKIYGGDSGDGTKERLEELIVKYELKQSVYLMGTSDSLESELAHGAFYVFSSDWEGLPNALMEAMALGLPVISTDCPCGGPATLIEHRKNGYLIPIKNRDALVEAMKFFIENPNVVEQYGIEGKNIVKYANAESVYTQWKMYVEDVIHERG